MAHKHYHAQLGFSDKSHAIKGLVVCWMLLNLISKSGFLETNKRILSNQPIYEAFVFTLITCMMRPLSQEGMSINHECLWVG